MNLGNGTAIGRGVAAGWFQVVVAAVAGPVQTYFLLRYLNTSDAGYWLAILSFTSYLALFDLGIGPTLSRTIAFLRGAARVDGTTVDREDGSVAVRDRQVLQAIADLMATAGRLYQVLTVTLVMTAIALGPVVAPHVAKRPFLESVAYAWVLLVLGSAANLLGTVYHSVLAGMGIVGTTRLARGAAQLVGLILSVAALRAGYGVPGVALCWVIQNLLFLLLGLLFLRRLTPTLHACKGTARASLARDMIGPSLRLAGISAGAAIIFAIGPAVISWYLGPASVPQYVVLYQLLNALYVISLIPIQSSEPFVAHAYSVGDEATVRTLLMRNVRHVAIPLICGSALLGVFGREIVTWWVGPANFAGYSALLLFIALFLLETHDVVHATVVMATGHVIFLPAAIAAGVLTVSLSLVLVPTHGIVGMVLGMLLAQVLTNHWYAPWYSLRLLHIQWPRYLSALVPLGWFACGTALAAMAAKAALVLLGAVNARVVAGTGLVVTGVVGLTLAWHLALEPAERQFMLDMMRRLRRRTAER